MIYAIVFILIVICQVFFLFWKKKSSSTEVLPVSRIKSLLLYNPNESKLENICFIAFGLILLYMAAFRDWIGYDWNNYLRIFHAFHRWEEQTFFDRLFFVEIEVGFALLNIIIPRFRILIFVIAIFSVPTKLWAINKYSEARFISLLMYFAGVFLAYDMGIIRQAISISLLLIGLQFVRDRHFFRFLLMILLGSLFHITTIIFIPLYFIHYIKFSRVKIYVVTALVLALYFVDLSRLLVLFLNLLPLDFITQRLEYYLDYETSLLMSLAKRVVVLIIFVEFYERYNIKDKMSRIFLNSYILSILIMAVFSSIPTLGARGVMGLYFLQVFIFAKIFAVSDKLYLKLGLFVIIIAFSIDTMTSIITEGNATYQPYTPFRSFIGTLLFRR